MPYQSPNSSDNMPHAKAVYRNPMLRVGFCLLGFVFVGLGILGVFVPGLPTTVFILLAGYSWAKSSPRLHAWLMRHKLFGKMLTDWQERRAMPRYAKYMAWSMMTLSCAWLFYRLPIDKLWIAIITAIICLGTSVWMYRLPNA
ncbi:MAG: YbaN family protein [Moraxella sp.]|nr:YbaN family protein [Moraxella sp.]